MARTLTELQAAVEVLVKDKGEYLDSGDLEATVTRAIEILALKSPYLTFGDLAGNGTAFIWNVPTGWVVGQSSIVRVYYPWNGDEESPDDLINSAHYDVFEQTAGVWKFRLQSGAPSATEKVRIYFTAAHTVTDSASTIYSTSDENAIVFLAAAECFRIMAAACNAFERPSIGADTTQNDPRVNNYLRMAEHYEERSGLKAYLKHTECPVAWQRLTRFVKFNDRRGKMKPFIHPLR